MLTLKRCLDDYVLEYVKPNGIGTARIGFAQEQLCRFFGDFRDVTTLKPKDGRDYRAKRLGDGVTDSTVRRELGVLVRSFKHAASEERLDTIPAILLPKEGPPRERWFSEEEVGKLMAQKMSEPAKLWIYIALGTGARKSAIETLPWSRVDFDLGFIDFRDPLLRVTKKRRAKVKIADFLLPVLTEARKVATGPLVVGKNVYPEIKKLLRSVGIDEKGIACHAWKRTMVTWALLHGADLARVAAATATSVVTLERNYLAVLPNHTAQAVNAVHLPERKL